MEAQIQIRHNAQEVQDYVRDLYKWETDLKRKEKGKHEEPPHQARPDGTSCCDLQERDCLTRPVVSDCAEGTSRSTKKTRRDADLPVQTLKIGSESAAEHTYEYARNKWDKFDVDAALAALSDDSDTETKKNPVKGNDDLRNGEKLEAHVREVHRKSIVQQPKVENSSQAPIRTRRDTQYACPMTADEWKAEGNSLFKSGRFEDAITAYSRSIELGGGSVVYANRAMALLKVNDNHRAEEDCTRTLELDDTFIKAWQRRGAARKAMGRYRDAVEDLEYALRLCPTSKAIRDEFLACVDQLRQQENVRDFAPTEVILVQDEGLIGKDQNRLSSNLSGSDPKGIVYPTQSSATTPAACVDIGNGTDLSSQPGVERQKHPHLPSVHAAEPSSRYESDALGLIGPPAIKTSETRVVSSVSGPTSGQLLRVALPEAPQRLPPAPKTGIEFEASWKGLKSGSEKSAYLKLLQPSSLPALLKCSMTTPLLMDLIATVLEHIVFEAPDHAAETLRVLCKVPRFNLALMGLSKKQREQLRASWDSATGVGSQLKDVRSLYNL